jgi:Thioredoxin
MAKIENHFLEKSLSYDDYIALTKELVANDKTTGDEQTEELLEYTKLNLQRMNRLDKTAVLSNPLSSIIQNWKLPLTILIITEAWCGDVAQQLPWFQKISILNPLIKIKTILRDDNPELMNRYLTNGKSKSIPVVLFLNEHNEELYKWGPRTKVLADLLNGWTAANIEKSEKYKNIHTWYAQNKGVDLQDELVEIFTLLSKQTS